jgi:hypothetical protein
MRRCFTDLAGAACTRELHAALARPVLGPAWHSRAPEAFDREAGRSSIEADRSIRVSIIGYGMGSGPSATYASRDISSSPAALPAGTRGRHGRPLNLFDEPTWPFS